MQPTHRKFSPQLGFAPNPASTLFPESFLKPTQSRPRFVSDMALDSTVSRAFCADNFSLLPIDEPIGKPFNFGPSLIISVFLSERTQEWHALTLRPCYFRL